MKSDDARNVNMYNTVYRSRGEGKCNLYSTSVFEGAYSDSGAHQSVTGLNQAKEFERVARKSIRRKMSNLVFRFGDGCERINVKIIVRIPTTDYRSIKIDVHIVDPDIPLLDVLRRQKCVLDFGLGQILEREGNFKSEMS